MPAFLSAPRPPARPARCLVVGLLVVLLGACTASDDGTRVRDRDGAGVPFEEAS